MSKLTPAVNLMLHETRVLIIKNLCISVTSIFLGKINIISKNTVNSIFSECFYNYYKLSLNTCIDLKRYLHLYTYLLCQTLLRTQTFSNESQWLGKTVSIFCVLNFLMCLFPCTRGRYSLVHRAYGSLYSPLYLAEFSQYFSCHLHMLESKIN